jgi:glycosyltransferase involved in cell wall biosynthesis
VSRAVLHVLEAIEGGTARHVVDITRHVGGWEHHVAVPARRVGGLTDETAAAAIRDAGGHVHIVPMRRSPARPTNAAALLRLRRLVRSVDAAVVHGHSAVGGALARLAAAGSGVPTVYTPNAVPPGRVSIAVERFLGHRTDRVIAVSESERTLMQRHRLAPLDRLLVVPNGIELAPPAALPLRPLLGVTADVPLVGSIARLAEQKAPEVFVRAAAIVGRADPGVHFVLIGDGPQRDLVMQEIGASGLGDRFHLLLGAEHASALLGDLDVFVLTSRFEGAPYSPLEAMRAGTPVVLTDVVGNRDIVESGRSGLLVPPEDPDAVADAVRLLLGDRQLAGAMVAGGRARLAASFDVAAMGDRLSQVYRDLAPS